MSTTKSKAVKDSAESSLNYEMAVAELEKLIDSMETGKLSLEETLAAYKRGAELLKHCQQVLEQVEQQVKVFEGSSN
jgi:exodeoxyribonuclease VII small subunit